MKKISSEFLLQTYGTKFKELYLAGKTVEEIKPILGLSNHYAYTLKRLLYLHMERWQRVGMPERFSPTTESLIFGTLMGDGSIHPTGEAKYKIFSLSHSHKQIKYLTHKRDFLAELKPHPIKKMHDEWDTRRFITSPHPQFDEIYQQCYESGSKQISKDVLSKLTPQAIAWWFMDDGNISSDSRSLEIATCSFDLKSIKNIREYLSNRYQIETKLYNYNYPRLTIHSKSAILFREIVEPYVIPSMSYKLDLSPGTGRGLGWAKGTSRK